MQPFLLAAAAHALQINHIFRRPTPFLNEKNTFTEDDGYKLLEGHREKRFTVAWARDLCRPPETRQIRTREPRRVDVEPQRHVHGLDRR